jgi:hypothetical protein
MKERPILFSGAMVLALLAGRKTQTRRAVKLREFGPSDTPGYDWRFRDASLLWHEHPYTRIAEKCPHGRPGDVIWARETWAAPHAFDHLPPRMIPPGTQFHYRATEDAGGLLWRPSIHMPRWASRITLEIQDVRVERLQEITNADAIDEGAENGVSLSGLSLAQCTRLAELATTGLKAHRLGFAWLWESINGTGSWDANPWIWRIEFRRVTA